MKSSAENKSIHNWKELLFFLLLFSIPFSFEYHFSADLGTDLPDEPMMVITAFVFLAAWIYHPSILPSTVLLQPLAIVLFLLLCWTGVSIIFSTHVLISLKFLLAKSWYIGAFVIGGAIMFSQKKNIINAGISILMAMLIVLIIVLTRHAMNGFQFAAINKALLPFFRNHVNYSALLVCLMPVAFAGYRLCSPKWKTAMLLLNLLFLLALVFSYSRGAWLALLVGSIGGWLASKQRLFLGYMVAIFLALGALLWLREDDRYLRFAPDYRTTIFHEDFKDHWIATYKLKDVSTAERFYRWVAGVRMVNEHWITGYGPNCFYEEYKPYALPAFRTWVSNNEDHSTVHNYFLLTAIEQGLPGLFLLLILFGSMIRKAELDIKQAKDIFEKWLGIVIASIVSMLLVLNFLSDLVETDKAGSVFFICIALLLRSYSPIRTFSKPFLAGPVNSSPL